MLQAPHPLSDCSGPGANYSENTKRTGLWSNCCGLDMAYRLPFQRWLARLAKMRWAVAAVRGSRSRLKQSRSRANVWHRRAGC